LLVDKHDLFATGIKNCAICMLKKRRFTKKSSIGIFGAENKFVDTDIKKKACRCFAKA
jgi:hypothetical protein